MIQYTSTSLEIRQVFQPQVGETEALPMRNSAINQAPLLILTSIMQLIAVWTTATGTPVTEFQTHQEEWYISFLVQK